ncbi:lamin tail domain-containing protein [Streptomyces griseoviridis]|uniref:Lamin tail domain-containing protein n=1 Tax=Streptomyces griseoviridis TaxID=45398 RepID=A0A3Q9KS94_STRGD|nr:MULTISPECIES: lamin tail domain-containing protein [Streptomyces]AZS83440.1 lamin tail domain-containing protein [Streptomyces griseoviridis]MDH6696225.1 hypothetical protein [Streptomyces sp. MAA16]QCN89707.1 hypothetical protein DDJ31_35970 [Streptomyces griseoviridis]
MSVSTSVSARRLAATALAAGALVGAVALPATAADHAQPHRAAVEISGVQHDAPGRDDNSPRALNREWVDITNNTRGAVNLNDWTLSDNAGHTYTFHHYRLDGRATVRVHTGRGHDTRRDLFQDRHRELLDNRAGTVTLRNDHRRVVSAFSWGRHHGGRH